MNSNRTSKGTFKPGQSGNPAGRPATATVFINKAIDEFNNANQTDLAQELMDKIFAQALSGCLNSQKLIVDKLAAPLKPVSGAIKLTGMPDDLFKKGEQIIRLVEKGEVSPGIGKDLMASISTLLGVKERTDLENRLEALEASKHGNVTKK